MPIEPKLNLPALQASCARLQSLLEDYSTTESDAELCLRELDPLFQQVMSGQIVEPRKGPAPCIYYFHEGSLRKYEALEKAYADFSAALQGWDDNSLRELFALSKRA